jgi:hypothetical protein
MSETKTPYGVFDLSRYDLRNDELIIGADDDLFLSEREKYRTQVLNKREGLKK